MNEFRQALSYLTLFPARPPLANEPETDLAKTAAYFPLVGLAMGVVLWILLKFFTSMFPATLSAALIVGAWVVMTGGVHLSRVGEAVGRMGAGDHAKVGASLAPVALVLLLFLKSMCVANLKGYGFALLYAPCLARLLMLWLAREPQAHAEGLPEGLVRGLESDTLKFACIVPAILTLFGGWRGLLALALSLCLTMGLMLACRSRRLDAKTPGILSLHLELVELAVLVGFCAGL